MTRSSRILIITHSERSDPEGVFSGASGERVEKAGRRGAHSARPIKSGPADVCLVHVDSFR